MTKAGYLPNISSKFDFWSVYSINKLDDKDYIAAEFGLHNINSLLTEDYLIRIDTDAYNKELKTETLYLCKKCEKEFQRNTIQVFDIILRARDQIVFGKKTDKVWFCPECKEQNKIDDTIMIRDKLENPYYRKLIPESPKPKIGIVDKYKYPKEFRNWFFNYLKELQHQLSLYRIEYIAQNGEDMPEEPIKGKRFQ